MISHLNVPVLVGILPLYSHKNAEFLHNEVPGMSIPDDIRERMRKAGSGDDARSRGRDDRPGGAARRARRSRRAPTSCRPSTRSTSPCASSRPCDRDGGGRIAPGPEAPSMTGATPPFS